MSNLPGKSAVPFAEVAAKMRAAELPEALIELVRRQHHALLGGETGKVPWDEIEPPLDGDIIDAAAAQRSAHHERGAAMLDRLVVIKLNGGLGTTMRLDGPKSLIPVRDGRSFLELVVEQLARLRRRHGARTPLLLMNSFRTRGPSLAALERFGVDAAGASLPLDFVQHKVPRIQRAGGRPLSLGDDRDWAPPGHGDIYLALWASGLLSRLVEQGYRWAFVSNVDNLGATVDLGLLGYLDGSAIEFAMEVTDKTEADKKGGTLVRRGGRLTLLERAQVEPERIADFEDIEVLSVFNTNSLWIRLDPLRDRLAAGQLELPLIINPKSVDGVDVVQLETAMGAAVGCFERAGGLRVPRSRFAPVKSTDDLLAVASDAYVVDDAGGVRPNPARDPSLGPPIVELDRAVYAGADALSARIPHPPSLLRCRRLRVEGDVEFGRDISIVGDVTVRARAGQSARLPDALRLEDEVYDV